MALEIELKTFGVAKKLPALSRITPAAETSTPAQSLNCCMFGDAPAQTVSYREFGSKLPAQYPKLHESGVIPRFEQVVDGVASKAENKITAVIDCLYNGKLHVEFRSAFHHSCYHLSNLLSSYGKKSEGSFAYKSFGVRNYLKPDQLHTVTAEVEPTSRGLEALTHFIEQKIPICLTRGFKYSLPYSSHEFDTMLSKWDPELYTSGIIPRFEQIVSEVVGDTGDVIVAKIDCLDREQLHIEFTMCKNLALEVKDFFDSNERNPKKDGITREKFHTKSGNNHTTEIYSVTVAVDPTNSGLNALRDFIEKQILPRAQNYSQNSSLLAASETTPRY